MTEPSPARVSPSRIWLCSYLLLTVVAGLLVLTRTFGESTLIVAMRLIFLAIFVLSLKRWTGALIFAFCQIELFHMERPTAAPVVNADSWILTGLTFLLLVVLSAYRTLQERDTEPAYRLLFRWFREERRPQNSASLEEPEISTEVSRLLKQLCRAGMLLVVCALAAWMILGMFPTRSTVTGLNTISVYRLRPEGHRAFVIGLTLFAVFLVFYNLINELTWRRHSTSQSRVFLNSIMLKTLLPDLRMIVRRRLKTRRKAAPGTTKDPAFEESEI